MEIVIKLEGRVLAATLDDNPSARDFARLLPLSLSLEDFNGTEKIGDLPRRIFDEGASEGYEPRAGDIAYYAPWANLAIFHRDFRHSPGLVRLGTIGGGMENLARPGAATVTIERATR